MPKPKAGEEKKDYLSRCMSEYADKYPDEKQRYAVCNAVWDREHGDARSKATAVKILDVFAWNEGDHPRHPSGGSDGGKFAPKDGADDRGTGDEENIPRDKKWNNTVKKARAIADDIGGGAGNEIRAAINDTHDAISEWEDIHADFDAKTDPGGKKLTKALKSWQRKHGYDDPDGLIDSVLALAQGLAEEHGEHSRRPDEQLAWNEGDHPRHPKGSGDGGKFAPKGEGPENRPLAPRDPTSNTDGMGYTDSTKKELDRAYAIGDTKKVKDVLNQSLKKDQDDARKVIKGLRAADMGGDADTLRDAAREWRNVIAAHKPDHEDYNDPTWRQGQLSDWRDEYGFDNLYDMVEDLIKELPGDMIGKLGRMSAPVNVEVMSSGQGGARERFSTSFKIEAKEEGVLSGTASMFGSMVETYPPTRVQKGAFLKTLGNADQMRRVKLLYQHNMDWPIGKPTEIREVKDGLFIKAPISKTQMGRDVLTLVRDGVLDELSIGFDPVTWRMVKEAEHSEHVRYLDEVLLWEISVVTLAADPRARVMSLHHLVPFQDLPLADIDQEWDEAKALSRVMSQGLDSSQVRAAFLWHKAEHGHQAITASTCKYLIADVVGGALKAVPRAIFAAASSVGATENEGERKALQEHLSRYYKKLDRLPPWVMGEEPRLRATSEWLASLPATAGFARRVKALTRIAQEIRVGAKEGLSARGRQSVEEAITELQGLLRSAEPAPSGATKDGLRREALVAHRLRELDLAALEVNLVG